MKKFDMVVDFRKNSLLTYEDILEIHEKNKTNTLDLHIFYALLDTIEFDLQSNDYKGQDAFTLVDECKEMVKELIYAKFNFEELFFKYED